MKLGFCLVALVAIAAAVPQAATAKDATPLHEGWRLQSACSLKDSGETISAAGR